MHYPYSPDRKCDRCKTGNMKWQAEVFGAFYNLGRHYCDNPECENHRENYWKLLKGVKFK